MIFPEDLLAERRAGDGAGILSGFGNWTGQGLSLAGLPAVAATQNPLCSSGAPWGFPGHQEGGIPRNGWWGHTQQNSFPGWQPWGSWAKLSMETSVPFLWWEFWG